MSEELWHDILGILREVAWGLRPTPGGLREKARAVWNRLLEETEGSGAEESKGAADSNSD